MATSSSIAEEAIQTIISEGAFYRKEPGIGERVRDLTGTPVISEKGFDFCKANVMDNKLIQDTLKSFSVWSIPKIGKRFKSDPEHYFIFSTKSEYDDEVQSLVVQLWSPGSRMEFFSGSHRLKLPGVVAANALFEVPYAQLKNCKGVEVPMEEGGLTILNACTAFRIIEGSAITYGFGAG